MKELDFSDIYHITEQQAIERYNAATHAMQSGVAMGQTLGLEETSPKHLRVGVNAAMVENSAIAELLIHKKLITPHEYLCAIAKGMEREKELYEARLSERTGTSITLG